MVFHRFPIILTALAITALSVQHAYAKAVISEVDWAGSDLNSSDEWVEIAGIDSGASMSGWTLTSVNSSSVEVTEFRFPAAAQITVGQFLIVSHFGAAQSRLLSDPAFITTSISLPNVKLLLRLRDQNGQIVDQVDDGAGDPFAGENSTTPLHKSTMERIDFTKPGDDVTNWMTAVRSAGLDADSAMFGTPGFPRLSSASPASTSSASSTSSTSSTSLTSSISFSSSSSSQSSSSCPSLDPYFVLQSGATSGIDKVTLNIQLATHAGTLTGASCIVDFDDGTQSTSCNPPSHAYDEPGTYTIQANVKSACGDITMRTMTVEVSPKSSSSSSSKGSQSAASDHLSGWEDLTAGRWPVNAASFLFSLTAILPNPEGSDTGKEWVEITNISNLTASLEGWSLRLPHTKKTLFTFGDEGFSFHESKRFLSSDLGMVFGNDAGELSLLNPSGQVASVLTWKNAHAGVVLRPQQSFTGTITATVTNVIDGDTIDVAVLSAQGGSIGRTERVRFIGIDTPELHAKDTTQRMLAKRAADFLRHLIEGTTITLTPGTDARDMYGRLLAYASTEGEDSIQETLLREGLASVYLRYAFAKEAEFIGYQREAQEAGSGMWGIIGEGLGIGIGTKPTPLLASVLMKEGSLSASSSSLEPTPQIVHLTQSSSVSSSKSSAAKKAPKKTAKKKSTKKASKFQSAVTPELLSVQDLIEEPGSGSGETLSAEEPEEEEQVPQSFPWVWIVVSMSTALPVGGVGMWALLKFRKIA